jgi:hypothetical protein
MQPSKTQQNSESPATIPPTSELFDKHQIVERHPNLLNPQRIEWALRKRAENGLQAAVYKTRAGQLFIHEPQFLQWFLGLRGRAMPRTLRKSA